MRVWRPTSTLLANELSKAQAFATETGEDVKIDLTALQPMAGCWSDDMTVQPSARPLLLKIQQRIEGMGERIAVLRQYMGVCVDDCDWHGVGDAAADIREYQAKIDILKEITE